MLNTDGSIMETKVDFDYSINTEDRFALRKWFDGFVNAQSPKNVLSLPTFFSVGLIVEGFTNGPLSTESFVNLLQRNLEQGSLDTIRYVDMKAKFKDESFVFTGNFEGLAKNILSYEGSIEIEVVKAEEGFKADYIKFYPRLKVSN